MNLEEMPAAELGKYVSAAAACDFVKTGMKIGLGTGSTAAWAVKILAHLKEYQNLEFEACATSSVTTELAESLGIKIHKLDELGKLDLAIDGADEFDPNLQLIKGGGGALLQEKIVESAADKLIVITDASKQVPYLGAFPLPVEVVRFGWQTTARQISEAVFGTSEIPVTMARRGGDTPFVTDEGHYIIDLHLGKIAEPHALSIQLLSIAGVVETGLFLDMVSAIVVGDATGLVRIQEKGQSMWQETKLELWQHAELIAKLNGTGQ